MSSLETKLSERNRILDDIHAKKDFIEGKLFKPLLDKITRAKKERDNLLNDFRRKQLEARTETNPTLLLKIEKELIEFCNKLSDIDSLIKELNDELQALRSKSARTPLVELENELNALNEELNRVNEEIATIRERDRKIAEEQNRQSKYPGLDLDIEVGDNLNYQKVIIDDVFGIYINYPKGDVISTTMNCIFGSGMNTIPKDYPFSKEQVMSNISNLELPGLPTLLNMFIDTLLKAIGQGFVKQFFFFKNTIDLLAGLQLGELLGTYIPGLPKIIKDIKLLLTDPESWMFEKMLGPLFDINIPIPDFKIDLGALIPFLPFMIKIPGIDPWGYFNKATPFNVNIKPSDIPEDWQAKIIAEGNKDQKDQEMKFADMRNSKLEDLNASIKKLKDDINGYNKYTKPKESSDRKIRVLSIQYEQIKNDVERNGNRYEIPRLNSIEQELLIFCNKIDDENKKLNELISLETQEQLRLDSLDKVKLQDELDSLIDERNDFKDQPNITLKAFKKRALLVSYQQKFKDTELDIKLSRLWDIGVNVFNNKVTEYLQKIGHNFKDDKYLSKIEELKTFGFKFNNSTHLERLYELGFSLNDPEYMTKLSLLKQFNIDILNTEILLLFIEMGMNFNNGYFISVVEGLNTLGVDLSDVDIMRKLNSLGFNFNNPNSPDRLETLGNYVDITTSLGYDNALSRNVNLNNPYFEDVLIKYNRIGLSWDEQGVENFDQEIKDNVKRSDVVFLLDVIDYYKNENGGLDIVKFVYNSGDVNPNKTFSSTDADTYLSNYSDSIFGVRQSLDPQYVVYGGLDLTNQRYGIVSNPDIPDGEMEIIGDNYVLNNLGEIYSTDQSYYNIGAVVETPIPGSTGTTTAITYTSFSENTRVYWVSLFDFMINRYSEYGIEIELNTPTNTYNIYGESGKILKEYVYPNNTVTYNKKIDGILDIQKKLELLLEFIDNDGWVVNGVKIDENYGQIDAQSIIDATDGDRVPSLIVTDIVNGDNQVSYSELRGIYGNFDKLGLNIRDPEFTTKMNILSNSLNIKADESVMLDVTRNVTMNYYDYKDRNIDNRNKTIDLSTTKVDPKFFENKRYAAEFIITNVIDANVDVNKIPTKPLVQFDSLNKLGFNFQQYKFGPDGEKEEVYADYVNLLLGLQFDMSAFDTVEIVDSLCALGWNFSANNSVYKISRLRDLGFSFFIQPKSTIDDDADIPDSTLEELRFKDMYGKLNNLSNFGFHFENPNWDNFITEMMNLNINMEHNDFETIISELISFGINLNDDDWRQKMIKLKKLGIDFSVINTDENSQTLKVGDKKWVAQLSNLTMMGIDFNDDDWLSKYNEALSFRHLGIDYRDIENRQKIAILVKLGIDFEKPRDDYMKKIESLVKLKLVTIPDSVESQKAKYLSERQQKLQKLQYEIDKLKSILSGETKTKLESDIKRKRTQQNQILLEIDRLKSLDVNDLSGAELTNISILLEKYCKQMETLNNEINDKLKDRESLKKKNRTDIEAQISLLKSQKVDLDNKVYLLNSDIGLAELDKFKGLDKLGINYYDPKWQDNVDTLLKFPFNFGMPDWRTLLPSVIDLVPKNPILMWIKSLIDILITLITMPIKTLVGIIKAFLNLIKAVIGIPLNPVKIPAWAKNIIKKFNDLIKLITGLPTLEGILDFLFMSTSGLMLIDIFVPGFADFSENLKNVVSEYKSKSKSARSSVKNKKQELNNLENAKLKRKLELESELKLKKNALDGGDVANTTKVENIKLKNKQDIFSRNIEVLRNAAKDPNLNKETLDVIELELKRNCDVLTDLENLINNNNDELNNLSNKSNEELQSEVDNLIRQLNNLDSVYDTDGLRKQISNINNNADEMDDKAQKLGNFCEWKDNLDVIIELLSGMIDFEKNKKDPYSDQVKAKRAKLDKLKKQLEIVSKKINNINGGDNSTINDSDDIDRLRKVLNKLNNQIESLHDFICNNKDGWTDNELWSNISKLQELEKLRDALLIDIQNKEKLNTQTIGQLTSEKNSLNDELLKTQKELKDLEDMSKDFRDKKDNKILELGEVAKWFSVIINIICCTPKFIVNIFVGLLNAIGHMNNLPTLWEFPLLE